MHKPIAEQAGTSISWKAIQHAGVKIIFLIRLVILARLLSPDDFGLLAISMVAIEVLMSITDFGMIPALVQRTDIDRNHYDSAWTVGVVRGLAIAGFVFLAAPLIADLFAEPRSAWIIRAVSFRPLIEASASIGVANLIRSLSFRPLAFIKLSEALANTVISIALAPYLGVWALVAGSLIGPAVYLAVSYILVPHQPRLNFDRNAVGSLIRFGRWIFLTGLIAVAGSSVLRVVISRQLGTVELGLYFLSAKLAFLPAEIASEVIGDVSFPLYSRLQENLEKVTRAFQSLLLLHLFW
jgi:O-antigen/teichoic acid export membrane protein